MDDPRCVLIVDDDRDLLTGLAIRLKSAGYEAITAEDGPSALELARQRQPAAILLDNYMPGIDGIDLLNQLAASAETSGIPVIMLSASVRDQRRAIERGARYFLQKPCDSCRVTAALKEAILHPTGSATTDQHGPHRFAPRGRPWSTDPATGTASDSRG